jgi:hypothetical protein
MALMMHFVTEGTLMRVRTEQKAEGKRRREEGRGKDDLGYPVLLIQFP